MNVKEYIESGILEAYAAGAVSDQERREVECLSKIYPEIASELEELQVGMEAFALAQAVNPPAGLKDSILAEIDRLEEEEKVAQPTLQPLPTTTTHHAQPAEEEDKELWLPPKETIAVQMQTGFTWAAAAVLVILIVSSFYRQHEMSEMKSQIAHLEEVKAVYEQEVDEMDKMMEMKESAYAMVSDPKKERIVLEGMGMPKYEEAMASVYWDKKDGSVALDVSVLPDLGEEEQYQLWVLVEGKPVDMGMVEKDDSGMPMQSMKKTMEADAFAITIEPMGGRTTPTLEKLIVLGKV